MKVSTTIYEDVLQHLKAGNFEGRELTLVDAETGVKLLSFNADCIRCPGDKLILPTFLVLPKGELHDLARTS